MSTVADPRRLGVGYRLSPRNACLNPVDLGHLEGRVDRDTTDLTILLDPREEPAPRRVNPEDLDLAIIADFNDAKAGPITGVPPDEWPKNR